VKPTTPNALCVMHRASPLPTSERQQMRHNPDRPLTDRERDIETVQHSYELAFLGVEPLKFNHALTWLRCAPLAEVLRTIETAAKRDNIEPLRSAAGFVFSKLLLYQAGHDDVSRAIHYNAAGQRCSA
jgi:hypothetical protein